MGHGVKILRWKKNSHKLKCYNKCISYIRTSWHIVDSSMFRLAPGQFVDHTSGSKFEVNLYLYEHLFEIFFESLQCSIYDMTMISASYKRDSMFNTRISGRDLKIFLPRIYSTKLFRYFVYNASIMPILLWRWLLRWEG